MQLLLDLLVAQLLRLLLSHSFFSFLLNLLAQVYSLLQSGGHLYIVKFELASSLMPVQIVELVFLLGHSKEFDGKLPFLQTCQLLALTLGQVLIYLLERPSQVLLSLRGSNRGRILGLHDLHKELLVSRQELLIGGLRLLVRRILSLVN